MPTYHSTYVYIITIISTPHNMPDPLALRRERKMHSKTSTKSPRVWKVCCFCCFPSPVQPAPVLQLSSLLAFITCSVHCTTLLLTEAAAAAIMCCCKFPLGGRAGQGQLVSP